MDPSTYKILPGTRGDGDGYSPISLLHEDVLLQIFLANTTVSHKSRLATARFTSHVCRNWRAVMLRSPVIWGRLIDLDGLTDNKQEWMREIISRSGAALLWINGPVICGSIRNKTPTPAFIFTFISENWPRIQRLNIAAVFQDGGDENDMIYAQYWTTLLNRPAPELQEFVFEYRLEPSRGVKRRRWIPPALLFDSFSPVLRKVQVYRIDDHDTKRNLSNDRPEDLPLGMPVSWLSRLRFLTLKSNEKWDVFQLMRLLKATPLLEELEVFDFSTKDLEEDDVQVIKLPELTRFHFENCDVLDLIVLLESISPSSRCCLIAGADYPGSASYPSSDDATEDDLYHFLILVLRYVNAYFRQNKATHVLLGYSYDEETLRVTDRTPLQQHESSRSHRLSISMPLEKYYADYARDILTDSSLFSSIEHLDIYNWFDAYDEDFPLCLCAFESVTTLIAGTGNIRDIMLDDCPEPMLPQLRVLQIGRHSGCPEVDEDCAEILPVFFRQRKEVGLPVAVLDLTAVKPYHLLCDLDNLEEFDGLLVRWTSATGNIKEYVCGSGRPEELGFTEERAVVEPEDQVVRDDSGNIHGWSGHL